MFKKSVMTVAAALFVATAYAADPAPPVDAATPAPAPKAELATPANGAPAQAPGGEARKAAAGAVGKPAGGAAADAGQPATQGAAGERKGHAGGERGERAAGQHSEQREARRLAKGGAGAKPGATQEIDWQARRAQRQAKRAASQGDHRNGRYANPHSKPAGDAAQ